MDDFPRYDNLKNKLLDSNLNLTIHIQDHFSDSIRGKVWIEISDKLLELSIFENNLYNELKERFERYA